MPVYCVPPHFKRELWLSKIGSIRVAAAAIASFLQEHEMTVYLAVFDRAALAVSQALLGAVQQYIDQNYVDEQTERFARLRSAETISCPAPAAVLLPRRNRREKNGSQRAHQKPQTEEAPGAGRACRQAG